MTVKVYGKGDMVAPHFYEDFNKRLYKTVENIDGIKDIGTDYDLMRMEQMAYRFRKDRFYLAIE